MVKVKNDVLQVLKELERIEAKKKPMPTAKPKLKLVKPKKIKIRKRPRRAVTPRVPRRVVRVVTPRRRFVQRYFIDKFRTDGDVEYEVFTIEVRGKRRRGEPAVKTKRQLLRRVQKLVR